jgi:outer membrane protein OmpA-like peptidoglycan-associated protein
MAKASYEDDETTPRVATSDSDVIDLREPRQRPGPRPRQTPAFSYDEDILSQFDDEAGSGPPSQPNSADGSLTDPRFLVPLALFLAVVLVLGLALRANSVQSEEPQATEVSELVLRVRSAETRAGYTDLLIRQEDELLIIEGEVTSSADATAVGAVARSVEGVGTIDNRVLVSPGQSVEQPVVTPSPRETLDETLAAAGQVTFDPGGTSLTAAGAATIDRVAAILVGVSDRMIEVRGHTDSDGEAAANQRLSQERSEAVVEALVRRGVNSSMLTAIGFGESQPLGPNVTEEGRAENRRIEFVTIG